MRTQTKQGNKVVWGEGMGLSKESQLRGSKLEPDVEVLGGMSTNPIHIYQKGATQKSLF